MNKLIINEADSGGVLIQSKSDNRLCNNYVSILFIVIIFKVSFHDLYPGYAIGPRSPGTTGRVGTVATGLHNPDARTFYGNIAKVLCIFALICMPFGACFGALILSLRDLTSWAASVELSSIKNPTQHEIYYHYDSHLTVSDLRLPIVMQTRDCLSA